MILWGMDRVINGDVFVALATRPDLELLEIETEITKEFISIARSRQNQNHGERQLFPQLCKLVCTGEIDGLFSLLPILTQLTHLKTTILGGSIDIRCPLQNIATSCPNLKFLQLEYTTDISADELDEPFQALYQALPHLEHLQISGYCQLTARVNEKIVENRN
jgi:hypothetical protein